MKKSARLENLLKSYYIRYHTDSMIGEFESLLQTLAPKP